MRGIALLSAMLAATTDAAGLFRQFIRPRAGRDKPRLVIRRYVGYAAPVRPCAATIINRFLPLLNTSAFTATHFLDRLGAKALQFLISPPPDWQGQVPTSLITTLLARYDLTFEARLLSFDVSARA